MTPHCHPCPRPGTLTGVQEGVVGDHLVAGKLGRVLHGLVDGRPWHICLEPQKIRSFFGIPRKNYKQILHFFWQHNCLECFLKHPVTLGIVIVFRLSR